MGGTTRTTGSFLRSNCARQYKVSELALTMSAKVAFVRVGKHETELAGPRPGPGGTFGLVT